MRLLFLIVLAVLAVGHYGANSQKGKVSSQGILGKALLRRALEAMSKSPEINVKKRNVENDDNGYGIKQTDAVDVDSSVGSGSPSEEGGESSTTGHSKVKNDEEKKDQLDAEPDQSGENDTNTESSGDDGTQTDEESQEQERNHGTVETDSSADQSEAQPSNAEEKTEDQEEDTGVSSGNADTVETVSEVQSVPPSSGSSETAPSKDPESSNASTKESDNSDYEASTVKSTVEVAKSDQTEQESRNNTSDKESDSEDTKRSTIPKIHSSSTAAKEYAETSISSGESDEVTSGAEMKSEESSGEDDGSAEAIRKGMESLSKLLKPVANGLDFQLFSGAAKPENEELEEEEDEKSVSKAEGKGESDKAEENREKNPRVVKVKKCETKCALPMSYDQCAVPRCALKMGTIKDLCVWLCQHQKPVCKQVCKEVE